MYKYYWVLYRCVFLVCRTKEVTPNSTPGLHHQAVHRPLALGQTPSLDHIDTVHSLLVVPQKCLFDRQNLYLETEGRVGHNPPRLKAPGTVPKFWRARKLGDLANAHIHDTLVPPPDHIALPNEVAEWNLASILSAPKLLRQIFFFAVAGTVYSYHVALFWFSGSGGGGNKDFLHEPRLLLAAAVVVLVGWFFARAASVMLERVKPIDRDEEAVPASHVAGAVLAASLQPLARQRVSSYLLSCAPNHTCLYSSTPRTLCRQYANT